MAQVAQANNVCASALQIVQCYQTQGWAPLFSVPITHLETYVWSHVIHQIVTYGNNDIIYHYLSLSDGQHHSPN